MSVHLKNRMNKEKKNMSRQRQKQKKISNRFGIVLGQF